MPRYSTFLLILLALSMSLPLMCSQEPKSDQSVPGSVPSSKLEAVEQAWNAKRRFFILVTVDKYTTPDADLPFATVDSQEVSNFLKSAHYEELASLGGTDATRDKFIEALKEVRGLPENSRVLVYYSGHGVLDAENKNLWLQMYGQAVLGDHHGVAVSEIVDTARGGSYSGELAIVLDSCFSGEGVLTAGLTLRDLGPSTTIFTSSTDIQESQKIDTGTEQMSAFTYSLLRALTTDWDQVDPAKSGFVGYKELHQYSIKQLRVWNKQGKVAGLMHPLLLSNEDMIFAYDPAKDKQGPSLYRDNLLGDSLYAALAPVGKLTTVTSYKTVALRYPIPSARARRIASFVSSNRDGFVAGLKAIAEGRTEDADRYLLKASQSRGLRARVARAEAWNALYSGRFSEATTHYKTALALAKGDSRRPILLETANALQLAGNSRDASTLYAQVVESGGNLSNDPLTAVALNNWGTAHITLGNIDEAEHAFDKSLALSGSAGAVNLDVATTSDNKAYVEQSKGNGEKAAELRQKSDEIRSAQEFKSGDYSSWDGIVAEVPSMAKKAAAKPAAKAAKKAPNK
jgi:tetratricopeptide (TPR) repeat protein